MTIQREILLDRITADGHGSPRMDDNGITYMGLKAFLLDPKSIEMS